MDNLAASLLSPAYMQELALALDIYARRACSSDNYDTAINGLAVLRSDSGVNLPRRIQKTALCFTFRERLSESDGDERPANSICHTSIVKDDEGGQWILENYREKEPFVRLEIELDLSYAQQLIQDLGLEPGTTTRSIDRGAVIIDPSPQLVDCALRSIRLLDSPEAISTLYPGIMREICYRLLTGPGRDTISSILAADNCDRRVVQAIRHLRDRFSDPISIEELASSIGMSPATFHRHFKSATSMSPLQYQKRLRLHEARRLMIIGKSNVEGVAFEVGYTSTSQFFREYSRMFGNSPRRDISSGGYA